MVGELSEERMVSEQHGDVISLSLVRDQRVLRLRRDHGNRRKLRWRTYLAHVSVLEQGELTAEVYEPLHAHSPAA